MGTGATGRRPGVQVHTWAGGLRPPRPGAPFRERENGGTPIRAAITQPLVCRSGVAFVQLLAGGAGVIVILAIMTRFWRVFCVERVLELASWGQKCSILRG